MLTVARKVERPPDFNKLQFEIRSMIELTTASQFGADKLKHGE